ncbi:MAG: flagellar hook-basal body complex protein FliE [Phycisphaerales bacterium]
MATSSRAMVAASEQATTAGAASATDAAAPLRAGDALVARIQQELSQARALGAEAERAAQALRAGETTDVAGVLLATRKADAAFQMLQAVRNAMLDAYAQMRDLRA